MSEKSKTKDYQLVLEGMDNQTPQSLQRIKGILVGDMEIPVEEAQKILSNFPLTIRHADNESELSVYYESLRSAGAQVLILKPQEPSNEQAKPEDSNEIDFKLEDAFVNKTSDEKEILPVETQHPAEDDNSIEFDFDFSTPPLSDEQNKAPEEPKEIKTYELNLEEDPKLTIAELEKELGETLQGTLEAKDEPKEEAAPDDIALEPAVPESSIELTENISTENTSIELEEKEIALETPVKEVIEDTLETSHAAEETKTEITQEKPADIDEQNETQEEATLKLLKNKKPPLKQKKQKKASSLKEIMIPIIVGGVILGAINWFYFSNDPISPPSVKNTKEKTIETELELVIPWDLMQIEHGETAEYLAVYDSEEMQINLKLEANANYVRGSKLELTLAKPAELTPEEIVRGVEPHIWLRKAEGDNFSFQESDDGRLLGSGPVRLYIEQGSNRSRAVATATIYLKYLEDENFDADISLELNKQDAGTVNGETYIVKNEAGLFSFSFSKTLILAKLPKTL